MQRRNDGRQWAVLAALFLRYTRQDKAFQSGQAEEGRPCGTTLLRERRVDGTGAATLPLPQRMATACTRGGIARRNERRTAKPGICAAAVGRAATLQGRATNICVCNTCVTRGRGAFVYPRLFCVRAGGVAGVQAARATNRRMQTLPGPVAQRVSCLLFKHLFSFHQLIAATRFCLHPFLLSVLLCPACAALNSSLLSVCRVCRRNTVRPL